MAHVYVRSGAAGSADGSDWANAYTTLAAALTAKAAGDQFWVSEDHSESTAGAVTLTSPGTAAAPCTIRCVNHAGTVPPVSADLTTGAVVASTGANALSFVGVADCDGIDFRATSSTSAGSLSICSGAAGGFWRFGSGTKLTLVGTNATSTVSVNTGSSTIASRVEFNGVTLKFAAVGQGIVVRSGILQWRGGSVDAAGSIPTSLFNAQQFNGVVILEGVDLSALGSGKTIVAAGTGPSDFHIKDCKLDAAVTVAATPAGPAAGRVFVSRTGSSAINYMERQFLYTGNELAGIDVVRTGGASAGHKIVTTANAKFILPYLGLPLAIWNPTTGSNITVTIEGIANMAAMPKNDEVWMSLEYLGTSGNPLGVIKSGAKADILATGAALTASTEAWDTGATARANSTAYALGDVIKVASNPGRLFFCTSAGTSAGSEPAGYASAVDGGSVTDSGATFRAGFRFKHSVTTTAAPTIAGLLYAYPRVGVASTTVYLDRKLVLS